MVETGEGVNMFYLCSANFFLVYFQAPSVLIIQLQICSSEFLCKKKKKRKVWAVTMRKLPATRTRGFHVEHWSTRSAAVYHREFRTSKQEVVSLRRNLCARACVRGRPEKVAVRARAPGADTDISSICCRFSTDSSHTDGGGGCRWGTRSGSNRIQLRK